MVLLTPLLPSPATRVGATAAGHPAERSIRTVQDVTATGEELLWTATMLGAWSGSF
jgi:hypothetical protein